MIRRTPQLAALAAALSLFAAACGNDTDTASTATTATPTTAAAGSTTTMMAPMMDLPASAASMKLEVTSPSADGTLTANELEINVAATGYELACDQAGKPLVDGKGHYHVLLDKSLIDMECTPTAKVSMQNVKAGKHTLEVVPAINDHAEVMDNAKEFTFNYQPTQPLPEITDATSDGKPTIKIVSPKPGDVVSGTFDVVVETTNFTLSEDLFGKPGVVGYGHWHVNLDTATGPMMGMGTMLGMSGTNTFTASTVGLKPGETHSVIALLVDNGHAPFADMVADQVDVTVG